MKPIDAAVRSHQSGCGFWAAGLRGAVLALTGLAVAVPGAAFADTILNFTLSSSSDLAGSTTGSPTTFCLDGAPCPTSAPYALTTNDPMSGTLSIDVTTQTMTFTLGLAQSAAFGGALTLDNSTTFSTPSAIGVTVSPKTKSGVTTYTVLPGSGTDTALGTLGLSLSPGFTQTENLPILSGLDCSVTSAGGTCGFVLGTPISGTNALQVSDGTSLYDGIMSINANLVPVPLPPSVWLMVVGAGCLLLIRRRARA